MLHIVLVEPEIAPNTGNLMRLCANTGASLHLVEPLGFELDDRRLRRAGLDYREFADVAVHRSFEEAKAALRSSRLVAFSGKGTQRYDEVTYRAHDALVFGGESGGLSAGVRDDARIDRIVRIPMMAERRSLNLANAVSIVTYEALRQQGFPGLE